MTDDDPMKDSRNPNNRHPIRGWSVVQGNACVVDTSEGEKRFAANSDADAVKTARTFPGVLLDTLKKMTAYGWQKVPVDNGAGAVPMEDFYNPSPDFAVPATEHSVDGGTLEQNQSLWRDLAQHWRS